MALLSKRSLRRLVIGALLLAVCGGTAYYFVVVRGILKPAAADDGKTRRASPPSSVQVARAQSKNFEVWVDALGTVTSLNTVTVRSRVDGELLRVHFKEGQVVRQGDLLAELDPRPFQVTLDQALAVLARDRALFDNAKTDLERYKTLVAREAAPRQQYETQQSLIEQYQATLKNDQASVDAARLNLSYCRIVAPISGRIGLRLVDPGNIVHAADSTGLLTLTQLEPISVLFSLPQDWLPQIQKRAGGAVPVRAFDRAALMPLASGQFMSLDNQIDTSTGTIKLRARFENRDGKLFPNQFVNVRMLMQTLPKAVVVPSSAIQTGAKGPYVYVVSEDKKVALKPVELGPVDRDDAVVKTGVSSGEVLVVDGADKLKDGATVIVRGELGAQSDKGPGTESKKRSDAPGSTVPTSEKGSHGGAPESHGDWKNKTPEEREKWRQQHPAGPKD
jgi:multidrug efflux system membrane fusion protein